MLFLSSFVPLISSLFFYLILLSAAQTLNHQVHTDFIHKDALTYSNISNYPIHQFTFNSTPYSNDHNVTSSNCTKINSEIEALEIKIATVVPILFALIFIIGLIGNALAVIVVVFIKPMGHTSNILILNLAIADLLFILFCVPFTAVDYALSYWPFGTSWCKIVQYLIVVLACASNYTLVLMSFDRYLAVLYPMIENRFRTKENTYKAICLNWILILLICMPVVQLNTTVEYVSDELVDCGPNNTSYLNNSIIEQNVTDILLSCQFYSSSPFISKYYQLIFMIISYLVPLLIEITLYYSILKKLWQGQQKNEIGNKKSAIKRKKRATTLVIIVILTFAICWAPIHTILVLKNFNMYPEGATGLVLQIASQVLAYMNSCMNPILYAFVSGQFRAAFYKVIACNSNGQNKENKIETESTSIEPDRNSTSNHLDSKHRRSKISMYKSANDLNNNSKDKSVDIIRSNQGVKNENFSIIADGGLFPKNNQSDYSDKISPVQTTSNEQMKKVNAANSNKKAQSKKLISSLKGRFKAMSLEQADVEFMSPIEMHPTDSTVEQCIPMHELNNNTKTVASGVESTNQKSDSSTSNDTMNKSIGNTSTATINTVTTMSGSNGLNEVFL